MMLSLVSCREKEVAFSPNTCKGYPPFAGRLGFQPNVSYFSTSEIGTMGLVLLQSNVQGQTNAGVVKRYQHPSWKKGGWLGPILLDRQGNIYSAPAPFVNIYNNPLSNNNTLYRVDGVTGEMAEFLRLPQADSINTDNPFGIIGMTFLCESGTLYVSTVAGSRRYEENGHIYAIDIANKRIIDQLDHTDAMGMGISYITGKRQLYFGTGRSSDVYALTLSSNGTFSGKPKKVFSLEGLGVRGDDKVRRIQTDKNGNLIVIGIEFNFNLIAPREKQETIYHWYWDAGPGKWNYIP